jgi:hypothetical protein
MEVVKTLTFDCFPMLRANYTHSIHVSHVLRDTRQVFGTNRGNPMQVSWKFWVKNGYFVIFAFLFYESSFSSCMALMLSNVLLQNPRFTSLDMLTHKVKPTAEWKSYISWLVLPNVFTTLQHPSPPSTSDKNAIIIIMGMEWDWMDPITDNPTNKRPHQNQPTYILLLFSPTKVKSTSYVSSIASTINRIDISQCLTLVSDELMHTYMT